MRKKFLNKMNLLLGAVSLGLAGCHSAKPAASENGMPSAKKYGPPPTEEKIMLMYGAPVDDFPVEKDTVPTPPPVVDVKPDEPTPCIYGVVFPDDK